jgi:hypothetical protein
MFHNGMAIQTTVAILQIPGRHRSAASIHQAKVERQIHGQAGMQTGIEGAVAIAQG